MLDAMDGMNEWEETRANRLTVAACCRTLFWDPVRAVYVAACGLMSVQRNTFRERRELRVV
jgi:hypothetical protein